jgi:hypothetical protein
MQKKMKRKPECGRAVGLGEAPSYLQCRRPGGLRGTESPVQEARGLTGDRVPCAGGQGAYGGRSPLCQKIEVLIAP